MQAQNTQHTAVPQPQQAATVEVDIVGWLTSHTVMLTVLMAVGWGLRYLAVRGADFPLQGGALEYQLVRAVLAAEFAPPWQITALYGGGEFPLTYPPLGIYIAALLETWLGITTPAFFRVFPAVASTLVVPLFYALCWTMLRTKALTFTATLALTLMPASIEWMIVGSGVIRVMGLLVALAALQQSYLLIVRRSENYLFTASLLTVLALLVHAEMGYFVLYSVLLMLLFRGHSRYSALNMLMMLVIVLMLVGLWLVPVIMAYGLLPFARAAAGVYIPPNPLAPLGWQMSITGEPFISVILTLGLLGVFVALAKRRFFLPAWLVTIMLLHPRSAGMLVLLPLAMLAAVALHQLVLPLIVQLCYTNYSSGIPSLLYSGQAWVRNINRHIYQIPIVIFIAGLVVYVVVGAVNAMGSLEEPLSLIEHETMAWIETNSDIAPDARFLVITGGEDSWHADATEAWFPVLAQHESILSVEHAGWQRNVLQTLAFHERLHDCLDEDITCLLDLEADIAEARGSTGSQESALVQARTATETVDVSALSPRVFDYVYISPAVRGTLVEYFAATPDEFLPLRREGGVRVYERLSAEEEGDS